MQSSRRKRDRVDIEGDGGAAPLLPPSDSRARSKLKTSTDNIITYDGEAAAEVTPSQVAETKTTCGQEKGTTDTTEGTNGGNDHSQAATTEPTAPMEVSKDPTADAAIAGHDSTAQESDSGTRQEQIAALISHRKILLERMKQCKTAADSRIKRNIEKQKMKANDSSDVKGQDGGQSSDSGEIEKYREICRIAAEASRKQKIQASDAAVERRSSVSLRRGSTVGQRMNASLSSLGSNSEVFSSVRPSDPNSTMPAIATSDKLPPLAATAVPGVKAHAPNSKQAALKSAQQLVRPVIPSGSGNNHASEPANIQKYGGGQPGQRKRSASTSQGAMQTYPGSASVTQAMSSLPLHAGTTASGLPFNRLAYPTVNFPEARALREKRDVIRTKLNALIHERLERIQQSNNVEKTGAVEASLNLLSSDTDKPSVEEYRLALPRMVLERGVDSPSKLPRRRKTHWDYLLEEMRWIATDFVEERKWKAASARTLASAVVSTRLSAVAPIESASGSGNENGNVEGDSSSQEVKDSVIEESEAAAEMHIELLEKMGARNYSHPGSSDTKLVRSVAHLISDMVAEVWMGTIDSGLLASTDEPLMSALARHNKLRKAVQNEEEPGALRRDATDNVPDSSQAAESEKVKENGASATHWKAPEAPMMICGGEESGKENAGSTPLPYEEISKRIDAASDRIKNRDSLRNRNKPTKEPVTLGTEQHGALGFVEFLWEGDDSIAPCLDGDVATGKTVLTCSLLWRRRSGGPQLLVCSPARLIRWAYELERFSDLNVYIFGRRCGLSSAVPGAKFHSGFQEGDVVICEFSSLVQEEEREVNLDLSIFHTVVVDARFPTESVLSSMNHELKVTPRTSGESLIPRELISHSWWAVLLRSLRISKARRLLIDNSECRFLNEEERLDCAGLSDRQRLDTLAAMAAFVVGPELFLCQEARSVQHKVVSWAKHCAKEGNARKRPSYGEVRGTIADAARPFRHTMNSEAVGFAGAKDDKWVARLCALSPSQRSAYEECCVGVRGALAFGSITDYAGSQQRPEPYEHAVQGLMKLRRVCIHSHVDDVMGKLSKSSTLSSTNDSVRFRAAVGSSVSQPDADTAADILSGSAKLRELVTILREECGFGATEDSVIVQGELGQELKRKRKVNKREKPRKLVAILAMLPEVQILTSILLNAIGIQNELLGSSSFKPEKAFSIGPATSFGSHSYSPLDRNLYSSMVWIDAQLSLLRFSSSRMNDDGDKLTTCQVVIASPVLVAADNGGLGIEAADMVVCLDEDWSGRDANILNRITKRCAFAHEMKSSDRSTKKDGGCNYIRLVCEQTCEHVFLSDFNDDRRSDQVWPTDGRGLLTLPPRSKAFDIPLVGEDHQVSEDAIRWHFCFPATSVLRFRGTVLSTVLLSSKPIPPVFATGDSVCFLPYQEWERNTQGNESLLLELVRSLIAEEDRSRQAWKQDYSLRSEGTIDGPDNRSMVPPFPGSFPGAVMTRHDMMVAPSRHYLDHFGNHLARIGGTVNHSEEYARRLAASSAFGFFSSGADSAISGEHLADAWHKSGLNCKPVDLVPSLLSYSAGDQDTPSNMDGLECRSSAQSTQCTGSQGRATAGSQQSTSSSSRCNVFSASFGSSREVVSNLVRDGNQGFEPLAYFPPVFPSLLTASEKAQKDVAHARSFIGEPLNTGMGDLSFMPNFMYELDHGSRKRKEPAMAYPMTAAASKRPRLDKPFSLEPASSLPSQRPGVHAASSNVGLMSSNVVSSGSGLGSERSDCHSGAVNPSIVTEDEASQWDQSSLIFDIAEDYGLLGVGVLSSDIESAENASMVSVDVLSYSRWRDPYEANGLDQEIFSSTISCDVEEIEAYVRGEVDDSFLDTMLLFVAKRAPSGFSGMSAPSTASQRIGSLKFSGANSAWVQSSTHSTISGPDGKAINGAAKKVKRKSQTHGDLHGGFAPVNLADIPGLPANSSLHTSKGRESYRSKILASILARQGGGRASLFQVPSFLLASIRIRDDVLRRVLSQSQAEELSRQPPQPVRRSWTRACFKLSSLTSQTGDSALQMSKRQRVKLSIAPLPVDFGPFVAGFVSSRVRDAPPRGTATGISLPMGVKIARQSSEPQLQPWATGEEQKLKESVLRYGMNWHLVATAVNNFDCKESQRKCRMIDSTVPFPCRQSRSPGQCHERWNHLVELVPDLVDSFRSVERLRHGHAVTRPTSSEMASDPVRRLDKKGSSSTLSVGETDDSVSLVLSSNLFLDMDGDAVMAETKHVPGVKGVREKKSFAALRNATKWAVKDPLPILGSVNGEKPTLMASHTSHAQVVQAAVASTSGGKADMWPLQILDLADKQRAARNASGSTTAGGSRQASGASSMPLGHQVRSPGRQGSPSRQPRPHASFQVPQGGMTPPSRSSQQGYPPVSANGGPVARGPPPRGPPPAGKSR